MGGMTVVWIVVALAVLVIVVALIAGASHKSSKAQEEQDQQEVYEQDQVLPATDERPLGEHWADGLHPDDPRKQAGQPEGHEGKHHPKHSKH